MGEKMKNILILFIIATLVLNFIPQSDSNSYAIEKLSDKSIEFSLLKALEVFSDFSDDVLLSSKEITRQEFIALLIRSLKLRNYNDNSNSEKLYEDVNNAKYYEEIAIAYNYGYIQRNSREFYPNRPIKYEEAIKLVVSALGYDMIAQNKGGYPSGHIIVAKENKILKDVDAGTNISFVNAIKLIYNMLNTPMLEQVSFGGDGLVFDKDKDNTILNKYYKIYKSSGTVTANRIMNLYGEKTYKNKIAIDGVFYEVSERDFTLTNIGTSLDFYYKESETDKSKTLVCYEDTTKSFVKIYSDDIVSINLNRLIYKTSDDEKETTLNLNNFKHIIYNNMLGSVSDLVKPSSGYIMLTDKEDDGVYELIEIKNYEYYVVDMINIDKGIIYDRFGKSPLSVDTDEIIVIKDGKFGRLNQIKSGDVLAVEINNYDVATVLTFCATPVTGEVEEWSGDELTLFTTRSTTYKSIIPISQIELGSEIRIFLDINSRIFHIENTVQKGAKFGWLLDKHYSSGINEKSEIKIINSDGKVEKLEFDEKAKLYKNGIWSKPTKQQLVDELVNYSLIKYEVTEKGLVKSIQYAKDRSTEENYDGYFISDFSMDYKSARAKCFSGVIASKYIYNPSSIVFIVPSQDKRNDEKMYTVGTGQNIVHNDFYHIEVYEADENMFAKVIVIYEGDAMNYSRYPSNFSPVMYVERISSAILNDERMIKISGFVNGSLVNLYCEEDEDTSKSDRNNFWNSEVVKATDLKCGDVIQYTTFPKQPKMLFGFRVIFRAGYQNTFIEQTDATKTVTANTQLVQEMYIGFGKVNKIASNTLLVNMNISQDKKYNRTFLFNNNVKVMTFDKSKAQIKSSNIKNITPDSKIFVRCRWAAPYEILIIE